VEARPDVHIDLIVTQLLPGLDVKIRVCVLSAHSVAQCSARAVKENSTSKVVTYET
jgi:hypothetical protein